MNGMGGYASQPIFLIRHAPVAVNLAVASTHWQLNDEGHALADRLAALPIFANLQTVWSSPEPKAQATAQPLAHRHRAPLLIDPTLSELHRGQTNLPDREAYDAAVQQAFATPTTSVEGWERACDAQRRIVRGVSKLADQASGPIAIVSHGLVLSLLLAHLRNQAQVDFAEWRAISLPALAIVDRDTWQLVAPFQTVEFWEIRLQSAGYERVG